MSSRRSNRMPLQLLPMELSDFETILAEDWQPPHEMAHPAVKEHQTRIETNMTNAARYDFVRDPTGRWFKIFDPNAMGVDEIIAYARWHVYNDIGGYQWQRDSQAMGPEHRDLTDEELNGWWKPSINTPFLTNFWTVFRNGRQRAIGGQHVIVLGSLVVISKHRNHGAEQMLLNQLINDADQLSLPIYIEAEAAELPYYHAIGAFETGEMIFAPQPDGTQQIRIILNRQPAARM